MSRSKLRNKIQLDVALEALRDCYRRKKATMDELFMAARVSRGSSGHGTYGVARVKKASSIWQRWCGSGY